MKEQTTWKMGGVKLLIGCFFLTAVILPLFQLLIKLKDADFEKIFSNSLVPTSILNSVCVSLCATAISVALAFVIAWCITRTGVRFKGLFKLLLILPMLIPSISHGMGLTILFGSNGSVTKFLGLSRGIYGFWGIVIGSVMYSFPVAFLMIADILQYEDFTPYEAAQVLGIPKARRLTAITLPYLRKPMINVIFATFTMIVTDYGVPIMVGGTYKTLPVVMYEEVIGRQNFEKGSVFGMLLLIPAVIAFAVDMFCKNRSGTGTVSRPFLLVKNRLRDAVSYIILTVTSIAVVYPIFSFAQLTFATRFPRDMSFTLKHISSTVNKGAPEFLLNSVLIAAAVSLIGTAAAFICAYFSARVPSKSSSAIHLLSITSLAVPGMVLGLSYVFMFKTSFIYGTLAILILVNTVHFFSSPYLMFYNSLGKLNKNLEAVGLTLGVGRVRMIKDVILPQLISTAAESASYFFVNSMMTISAVAFLANAKTRPISLMITQFEAQLLLESAAFVSLLILAVNLIMKGVVSLIKHHAEQRKHTEKESIKC